MDKPYTFEEWVADERAKAEQMTLNELYAEWFFAKDDGDDSLASIYGDEINKRKPQIVVEPPHEDENTDQRKKKLEDSAPDEDDLPF